VIAELLVRERENHKFLTRIFKYGLLSNTWQSLVEFGDLGVNEENAETFRGWINNEISDICGPKFNKF